MPLACKDVYLDHYAQSELAWTDRDESRWPVPYWYIDTGFTVLLILLAAVDEELGAVFFGIQPSIMAAWACTTARRERWYSKSDLVYHRERDKTITTESTERLAGPQRCFG